MHHVILFSAFSATCSHPSSEPLFRYATESLGTCRHLTLKLCCPPAAGVTDDEQSVHPTEVVFSFSLADSSDADRLERFFDSEDEDFEILSL